MSRIIIILMLCTFPLIEARAQGSTPLESDTDTADPFRIEGTEVAFMIGLGSPIVDGHGSVALDFRYWSIGLGIAFVSADTPVPEHLDYAPPHGDVSRIDYELGYIGGDLRYFVDLFTDRVSAFAGVGYYGFHTTYLYRSNVTGLYYEGGASKNKVPDKVALSGGLTFDVTDPHYTEYALNLGIEYNTVRGLLGSIGVTSLL